MTGAEGRGDRSIRRRSRFTLARARAEPFLSFLKRLDVRNSSAPQAWSGDQSRVGDRMDRLVAG